MSAPDSPLPYTLGQLAIACHDEWLGNLRVIKELEVEQWRAERDHPWTQRVESEVAFTRAQAESMRVLWLTLKALSRHEAEIMPLITVALAADGGAFPPQIKEAAHERA